MPSHNHDQYISSWDEDGSQLNNGAVATGTRKMEGSTYWHSEYTGGNQPHNITPRFMSLAYIMKL